MTNLPLVSVVIPTYNRARKIGRSIASVLDQTYERVEVIVVDDGSTDDTRAVLEGFGSRIKTIFQENAGPSAARNKGVAESRGEIIAFQDSDDVWRPQKLARQVQLMVKLGPDVPCCVTNARIYDAARNPGLTTFEVSKLKGAPPAGVWYNPSEVLLSRFLLFNQVVAIWRESFDRTGGFPPELRLLEDYYLSFKLSLMGPWGVLGSEEVEKFNDADGIGVQAMSDALKHARAKAAVLELLLADCSDVPPEIRHALQNKLTDMHAVLRTLSLIERGGLAKPLGLLWRFSRKLRLKVLRALAPEAKFSSDSFTPARVLK